MTTVNLDDLLAARQRELELKGRKTATKVATGQADELTLLMLIGLWFLITGLILLKTFVLLLEVVGRLLEAVHERSRSRNRRRR